MKAAVHTIYRPPEVVKILDLPRPTLQNNEVLVKVMAATVNRTDCGFRSAEYFISRFWSGLFKPKYTVLGCEFAGIIDEIGDQVKDFKTGDRVFGYDDTKFGGHAEYKVISADSTIAGMSDSMRFEDAAPMTEGVHYALNAIRAAGVKPGQKVLVYGATGAIGSAALQLLKYFDTEVTAVCNTKNMDLIKSLGADYVIDYTAEDFTLIDRKFDFILDAVGKSSFGQCKPLLKAKGIYISTELGAFGQNVFLALFTPLMGAKKVLFPIPKISKTELDFFIDLYESGKFKPVIDRKYTLDQIVDAYKYVETGQKTGSVILLP